MVRGGPSPKAGFGDGLDVIGRATSLTAIRDPRLPQYLGELLQPLPSGFLPGTLLVLLVVALAVTWRRRWTNEGLLVGGLLLTWIVAFVAASNISGPPYSWLYLWVHPLTWLSWAAVALVVWRLLSAFAAAVRIRPWIVPVAGAAAALVLIGLVVDHARRAVDGGYVWEELVAPIDEFAQAAEANVDRTAPVFLTFDGDAYLAHAVHAGIVNQLDQRGVNVAVVPEATPQFGSQRVIQGPPGTQLLVRAERTTSPTPPGAIVVAVADEVPSAIRQEMDQLTETLSAILDPRRPGQPHPRPSDAARDVRARRRTVRRHRPRQRDRTAGGAAGRDVSSLRAVLAPSRRCLIAALAQQTFQARRTQADTLPAMPGQVCGSLLPEDRPPPARS